MWYRHAFMNALKSFVLWLLIAVIPLHGIAANAVMTCKAAHQGMQQVQVQDAAGLHGHHQHPGHIAMQDMQDMQDSLAEAGDTADEKADHTGSFGGSCTAFCPFAVWMRIDEAAMPILANASDRISYLPFHVPFVVPDGPEHRPRFLPV